MYYTYPNNALYGLIMQIVLVMKLLLPLKKLFPILQKLEIVTR